MVQVALRTDGALTAVLAWIAEIAAGGFGVREVSGDNEHWHWLLETDKTYKAVRCSFNKKVPELKGNGAYSMSEVEDVEKYERYMCKGESDGAGPEVVWRNSMRYTEEKCSELHEEYWAENRKLKKRKAGSMIDWVVDEAKRNNIAWDQRSKIAEIYIRELGARSKPINLYSIRSNLNAVQFALCPDDSCLKQLVGYVEQF